MKIYTKSFLALFISFNISSESLLDIYNEALENDPTYKAAEYSYLADKELKVQGRAALLPSITLSGSTNWNEYYQNKELQQQYNSFSTSARVTQPLFRLDTFYTEKLPFQLTNAQKRVIKEIRKDFLSGEHMNRLLQGDVGSGKTLVALMTMLLAADNGYQAAIMAPTEILANQHYESLNEFLSDLPINVSLLTGSTKKSERKTLHEGLENGEIHILVGTHALLEDTVKFKNIGLVVIDEQHRFGVAQRSKMWGKNTCPPHILIMTATPIPRTLAMTFY